MTEAEFRELATEIAKCPKPRLFVTKHAKERMAERKITIKQVKSVLIRGRYTEGPYQSPSGDWVANLRASDSGQIIEVVVALKVTDDTKAFVITVIDKT